MAFFFFFFWLIVPTCWFVILCLVTLPVPHAPIAFWLLAGHLCPSPPLLDSCRVWHACILSGFGWPGVFLASRSGTLWWKGRCFWCLGTSPCEETVMTQGIAPKGRSNKASQKLHHVYKWSAYTERWMAEKNTYGWTGKIYKIVLRVTLLRSGTDSSICPVSSH